MLRPARVARDRSSESLVLSRCAPRGLRNGLRLERIASFFRIFFSPFGYVFTSSVRLNHPPTIRTPYYYSWYHRHKYDIIGCHYGTALRPSFAGIVANETDDVNVSTKYNMLSPARRRSAGVYQTPYDFVGKTTSGMDGCRANDPDQLAPDALLFLFPLVAPRFCLFAHAPWLGERSRVS